MVSTVNNGKAAEGMQGKNKITISQMAVTALMAALMCILGPLSVPIGPVPISLTNLVIYFAVYILGTRFGTISYLVYFLLGAAGLPVFSGFSGGLAKLAGPTGGYLVGFIFMAMISGAAIKIGKGKTWIAVIGMVVGTLVAYAIGTVWFIFLTKNTLMASLTLCVFPFLIGDGIKIALAASFGGMLRSRLIRAGFLQD
jgi:biotin transport system substrate-specific component